MNGIPASPGVAVGRLIRLEESEAIIERRKDCDAETEIQRLKDAAAKSAEQIADLYESMKEKGLHHEAEVFEAHRMLFDDPEWIGKMESKIRKENLNAEAAAEDVTAEFVAVFEMMDDDYLKERAADLKDVNGRLIRNLMGVESTDLSQLTEPVILAAHDLKPSDTARLDRKNVLGFITAIGNKTSHTAIIARTLGIPAVVGYSDAMTLETGAWGALDGETGEVWFNPDEETVQKLTEKRQTQLERTELLKAMIGKSSESVDGFKVELACNIGKLSDAPFVIENDGEGVGLFRSEFLFMDRETAPTEDEQYESYKAVAEALGDKPVVIRTLDAGGDKNIPYLNGAPEMNPFLGYRAIRICLDDKELFQTQLRAIYRASVHGNVKIMFPMIATLSEWRLAKAAAVEAMESLKAKNISFDPTVELGIMVEIPSAAILAEQFAKEVDFFSIGTNDLTQYTLAADRMNEKLEKLYSTFDPAVLSLIATVIRAGRKAGKWVGMCGEAAGDLRMIPILLGLGLEEFSMAPASVLKARNLIRSLNQSEMQALAESVLTMDSAEAIEARMRAFLKESVQ